MSSADALLEVADGLYAVEPSAFTPARDAASRDAKSVGDVDLAARVKRLKKPSVAAWAVNLLVRREREQIDQVLALGESLRTAAESLDGEELRALTRQRRQLTGALAGTARSLARELDVRLSPSVVDQVEGVLTAALLDRTAAEVVRSGMVLSAFTATGVGEIDVPAVCAVPEAVGTWTARTTEEQHEPPKLALVPDHHIKLEAARERLEEALTGVHEASTDVTEIDGTLAKLQARRLQLREEIDELQRRLVELETEVEGVDEDIEEAESARDEATEALDEARAEQRSAEAEVERLEELAASQK